MIYISKDSHGDHSYKNLENVINLHQISITMHRVGRDGLAFINFLNHNIQPDSTVIFQYGEVDCRCHIYRQIQIGRQEDEIMETLISNYERTILENIKLVPTKIIIGCIPPPVSLQIHEQQHGPLGEDHPFPILGTDEIRVHYTNKMNALLKNMCVKNNWKFLDYCDYYKDESGLLRFELSDTSVHIRDNSYVLNILKTLL